LQIILLKGEAPAAASIRLPYAFFLKYRLKK
jgi:hypothetical protein